MTGFVVVDVETTGLSYPKGDRIVEIGMVLLDTNGAIQGTWETLINPERAMQATEIHGIRGVDVIGAPTFPEVADFIAQELSGRTFVAHNASFDARFIAESLQSCGRLTAGRIPYLDTMRLAKQQLHLGRARLVDCCAAAGITNHQAHSALGDAVATSELLTYLLHTTKAARDYTVRQALLAAQQFSDFHPLNPVTKLPVVTRSDAQLAQEALRTGKWIPQTVGERTMPENAELSHYFALLDKAFLDGYLSRSEETELLQFAQQQQWSPAALRAAHEQYFDLMAKKAWRDGVLTEQEKLMLHQIETYLGIPSAAAVLVDFAAQSATTSSAEPRKAASELGDVSTQSATEPAEDGATFSDGLGISVKIAPGDRVTVTGPKLKSLDYWTGYFASHDVEIGGIAKKTKLLIAGDPDTQSGKARKAREYGIPIVSEAAVFDVVKFQQ